MATRKDLVIAVLCTFCLAVTLFAVVPTRSQSTPEYNYWADINDDGFINGKDALLLGVVFEAQGTPINKTALLKLLDRIDSLNASLLALEAYFETRINTLNATIVEQQSRIEDLETCLTILNATKLGKPDYDSFEVYGGWKYIEADSYWTFEHGLGTTDLLVYLVFSEDDVGGNINHHYYGAFDSTYKWAGAWWCNLTDSDITVKRWAESDECSFVRVCLWKIPES